jgi:L-threonylcarbamoyladenylate synthase
VTTIDDAPLDPDRIVDARTDRRAAVAAAAAALRDGELVVLPTDTVYGLAADAFHQRATDRLFAAKERDTALPLPVLVRSPKQLLGLSPDLPPAAERLMAAYWPGPLTLVVAEQPGMQWRLGDNDGTVAVRMPHDDVALAVIAAVGPLAVTSANLSGHQPATTVAEAHHQLGDRVRCYLDDGPRTTHQPSTIVDLTRVEPVVLRTGALPDADVLAVAAGLLDPLEASARWNDGRGDEV